MSDRPVEPPLSYEPSFGPRNDYIAATLRWVEYWKWHRHVFKPCTQCEGCGLCAYCALSEMNRVHG